MAGASRAVVTHYLGIVKQRLGDQLGSPATKGEGRKTCSAPTSPARCCSACFGNALVGA
jgi:hypothetical protein